MRWLQNISASPTLSPSSSPSTKAAGDRIGPKLTRQRNLRYLSEQEIAGALHIPPPDADTPSGAGVSPASLTPAAAAAGGGAAAPQPLPLPEISLLLPRTVKLFGSQRESGDCPLPSPEEAGIFRDRSDVVSEGSNSTRHDKRMIFEPDEGRLCRRLSEDLYAAESKRDGYKIQVPIRSAPPTPFAASPFAISPFAASPFATSPFANPLLSPPKISNGDFYPYYYITPKANQMWSAPEMPTAVPLPTHPDYTNFSSESSSLQSPPIKSPPHQGSSRSISGVTPISRRESNSYASVHPLPLPPGAVGLPSPSSSGNPHGAGFLSNASSGNPPGAGLLAHHSSGNPAGVGLLSPCASGNPHLASKPESLPFNSHWQKGKLIGRGTFGSVYVASNLETGALCAMKEVELFPDDPKSIESMKQLQQEIKVLSRLKHPNIVQYYGSEIIEDRFYIYLEYVHPGSINKFAREHCSAITESVVRCFTRHILSGLAYLHSKMTIHRDIKGANLLVDASGVVKLADFGMAKHLSGQTYELSLKGSPYWMAPELMNSVMQSDSKSDIALAVDIWSLGCTIIEMLTGKPPWSEYEGAAAMFKILKDTPPIPDSLSPEGKDFLQHCFQRNPAERPSAAMLLEHPFIKASQVYDSPSSRQATASMKLMELTPSPSQQRPRNVIEPLTCPSARKSNAGFDGDSSLQFHHRAFDVGVPRISPRSILEALPILCPPYSDGSSNEPITSSYPSSSVISSPMKNRSLR